MGRRPLPIEEKKTKRQIAKDYRERNAEKVKDYELIRQEKRKLERLLKKKASIIIKKDVDTQTPLSEHNNLKLNTKSTSLDKLTTPDEEVFIKHDPRKEENLMMKNIFQRSPTDFLHDILDSMDGALDIKVICFNGTFMWSRLLLSLISPHMNNILNEDEKNDDLIVDTNMEASVVQEALRNLSKVDPEWKEDFVKVYEMFHIPRVLYELDHEQNGDDKETINSDVGKVEVLDFYSTGNEPFKIEESNFPAELSPAHYDDYNEGKFDNPEDISQMIKMMKSTLNESEYLNSKAKQKKTFKKTNREKVYTKDQSPERFIGGKKVKWICVTQKNVSSGAPYHCIGCSYKSNSLDNVKKHYRIHTGEKLFGCKVCDKKIHIFLTSYIALEQSP